MIGPPITTLVRVVEVHFERGFLAMTPNRSITDALPARGVGRLLSRLRLGFAFACLVGVGLTQTGCRSDGCSNCDLGSKLTSGFNGIGDGVRGVGARIFHHKDKGCSTCGTLGGEEGVIVEGGTPIAAPGAIALPGPATIVPPPATESAPSQLEPISSSPGASSQPNSSTSSRNPNGANRSAYEAANTKVGAIASKRGRDLSRAYESTPAPTQTGFATSEEPDVLDHLPPVDLPSELSRKATPADKPTEDPADPKSSSSPPSVAPSTESAPKMSSAETNSAGVRAISGKIPVVLPPGTVRANPGMVRSASVAPSVTGGSLPSAEGLAWLKEKGYRTLVDLRGRTEVDPAFPDLVTDHGLLYVAIPFSTDPINLGRLARFNDLMTQADQRPLYFCDLDGRRAGLLWYLRLRSKDREDAGSARSKAEEIGLLASDIPEAEKFLKLNFAMEAPVVAPAAPEVTQVAAVLPVAPSVDTPVPVKSKAEPAHRSEPVSLVSTDAYDRNPSWKPMAALVLSGLGVPLVYWSSSTLLQRRSPRRASLTARPPGPRKSLPSSGA